MEAEKIGGQDASKSCPVCAGPIPPAGMGQTRIYCGDSCRRRAEYLRLRDGQLAKQRAKRARRRQWRAA